MKKRTLTLKQRLLLTGLILAITPLLALGIVCWRQFNIVSLTALQGTEKLAASDLAQAGENVYNTVNAAQNDVLVALQIARATLNGYGGLQLSKWHHTTWDATNQETHDEKKVSLPSAAIGSKPDRHNRAPRKALVDQVQELTGATCTVFQRMNSDGDMLRISTTVVNAQGKRAVGTYIPAHAADGKPNAVLAQVLTGKTYRGKATVVGRPFMTAYEPITAADGTVIGMLYTGLLETAEASRVRDQLVGTQSAHRGEVFALATAGPALGDTLFSTRSSNSSLSEAATRHKLVTAAMAHPGEASVQRYQSVTGVPMIAHLRYFESWKWLLGVAIPEADFFETARQIDSIAAHSHLWLEGVFAVSLLASLLIWTRYAGWLSSQLAIFARRTHEDGLRILSWARRLASSSKDNGSGIREQLATVEHASVRIQKAAHENEKRTEEALKETAASDRHSKQTQEQLTGMQASMQQLNAVNAKISGLMKTVDDIAFQSRILALNARIEAARAGEAGVSFAVVAEQFGALAERCAEAAKSTTDFLTDSSVSTREGMEKLQGLTKAIGQMGESVAHMRTTVNQVHDAAGEQVQASAEIANALSVIRDVIERNQQMASQSSQASNALQRVATELNQHTNELTTMLNGANTTAPGPQLVQPMPKTEAKHQPEQRSAGARGPANNRSVRRAC